MTHLAIIAGTYNPDQCGVAHYTSHLRKSLYEKGIHSTVLTTHSAAQQSQDPTILGVVQDWNLHHLISLLRAIHATNPDILHIQHAAGTYGFQRPIFLLPLFLRLTGWNTPIVTTIHEYGWWEWQPPGIPPQWLEWLKTWGQQRGWWDREDGFLLTHSDAIITTNRDAEKTIQTRLPDRQSVLHRIPIGANIAVASTDRATARQQVRQQYGWADDTQIIAFFGFLHPVKGLETLLPAFQQVVQIHPQARLLLIGGVESLALPDQAARNYWDALRSLISQLELDPFVQMTGYLDAETVSQQLAGVDLGVLPFNHGVTLKSGSLLALMAHALPVVATCSNPPDPELETSGVVKLIPSRRVEPLTAQLIELLHDPSERDRLGSAGYTFSQQFTWPSITDAHLKIYQTVLSSRVSPSFQSSL